MSDALQLLDLEVRHATAALFTLSLDIAPGEIVTIMGPSGVGKSSLLNAVTGFLPDGLTLSGQINLAGHDITHVAPHQRNIGMMFQEPYLFPHMSVGANLAFGLCAQVKDRQTAVNTALSQAGLAGFADRDPASLSGGQKTRVALMRCLLAAPKALLLDEPFSNLDRELRHSIRGFVFDQLRGKGLPCLLVTHDLEDAQHAGGRVIHLDQP